MKEVKAYVRADHIERIARELKKNGVQRMTIIHVRAVGRAIDPMESALSIELADKVTDMVKIEVVCKDQQVDPIIEIIADRGRTGRQGDGIVYVSAVEDAVKIRTGERGDKSVG